MSAGAPGSRSEFQCASVFAAQGQVESERCISTRCVLSMSNGIFIFQGSVLAAQRLVESELCISMMYALRRATNKPKTLNPKVNQSSPRGLPRCPKMATT